VTPRPPGPIAAPGVPARGTGRAWRYAGVLDPRSRSWSRAEKRPALPRGAQAAHRVAMQGLEAWVSAEDRSGTRPGQLSGP
jgi:hypothetical protein